MSLHRRAAVLQVIAGTAGVPPAMSAQRENSDSSTLIGNGAHAGGTPAVPSNSLVGCGEKGSSRATR